MRNTARSLSALSFAVVLAGATPALAQPAAPAPSVVVASGESRIKVAPDQAWATVSLETRDSRGAEARRLGAAAMTSVMATLKKAGLDGDAGQTIGISLHPEYDYANGRQRMKGMIMSNQVQVRIDDISKVADVLDAVGGLTLPASSTLTVGGLRFDLKNRAGVQRDALRLAVEDAVARAKALAAGAGMSVGRTLRIEEAGAESQMKFPQEQFMMARAGQADASMPTPISPSDIEIRAQVTVTVEIK
ncbi:MAG: DUF541 domain-containing protein [Acidobacteria bacterium]|nr:DUF541 domain-containing protein [Acidobacteriota bacterium]